VIFRNPAGAPELACDECGCRWFDRMRGHCYECGAEVSEQAQQAYREALEAFRHPRAGGGPEHARSACPGSPPARG
jgi:DNA-directed RNA polymerase subunit RPC12/RpoP